MCGICVIIRIFHDNQEKDNSKRLLTDEKLYERLKKRGPDSSLNKTVHFNGKISLSFFASVLHLRGKSVIPQPYYEDEDRNFLLFNGEIFGGPSEPLEGESDVLNLYRILTKASDETHVLDTLSGIHGPWAVIYWQEEKGLLWFGRDTFGRRSLLWSCNMHPSPLFSLSSVELQGYKWDEVPANGVYCLDVIKMQKSNCIEIQLYMWSKSSSGKQLKWPTDAFQANNFPYQIAVTDIKITSPIKECMNMNKITTAFCETHHDSSDIPVLENILPEYVSVTSPETVFKSILGTSVMDLAVSEFECILDKAVGKRIKDQPFVCQNCFQHSSSLKIGSKCHHSSVGILFSGGIDSMVLAALASRHIPENISVDLINVAFSCKETFHSIKKGRKKVINQTLDSKYNTPDRVIGRQGVQELQRLFPLRTWNFVEVNVTQDQLESMRFHHIRYLINPAHTVLDDSIGCACWFAAKGEGIIHTSDGPLEYCSPCRVVLLGMGADEQLAGYSRHRSKYNLAGWDGVVEELSLELDRISSRNLGRDDRIISDHGREARFPFLDEDVVSFLNKLPVNVKADFKYPRGIGEKLLLRLFAYKLGLKQAASIPKRAIQFGSRIARCENYQEKGSDVCPRLCLEASV